jgi:hypothetical protein
MTGGEIGYTIRRENEREGYDNIEREGCLNEIERERGGKKRKMERKELQSKERERKDDR